MCRREINLNREIYQPVLNVLEKDDFQPKTMRKITQECKLEFGQVLEFLMLGVHQNIISPTQPLTPDIEKGLKFIMPIF